MNILLDILGSLFIGALLTLTMLGFYLSIGSTTTAQIFNQSSQEDLRSLTDILENDFRKMGYRITDSTDITYMGKDSIQFRGDFNNDTKIDSVLYYLSSQKPTGVQNPRLKTLYREYMQWGSPIAESRFGVTMFSLSYYDAAGNPLPSTNPTLLTQRKSVRSLKISVGVESGTRIYSESPLDTAYAGGYWERTIRPKNL
jgi:hypothetical protein